MDRSILFESLANQLETTARQCRSASSNLRAMSSVGDREGDAAILALQNLQKTLAGLSDGGAADGTLARKMADMAAGKSTL